MTQSDTSRWDARYAAGNPNPEFAPDPLLLAQAELLHGPGLALDLACGVGHNALFLARRGFRVIALDASLVGLRLLDPVLAATGLAVDRVAADLDRFPLPSERFDVVVVMRYLNRDLFAQIKRALVPGGLVLYRTFNWNWQRANPNFRKEYLLRPGELAERFADFETIATNDAPGIEDDLSFWVGRRPRP